MPQYSQYKNESKENFEKRMKQQNRGDIETFGGISPLKPTYAEAQNSGSFKDLGKEEVAEWQKFLKTNPDKENPYYTGKVDSIPGPLTQKAYMLYEQNMKTAQQHSVDKLKGAGYFGKDKDGNRRTPFKDIKNMIVDHLKNL